MEKLVLLIYILVKSVTNYHQYQLLNSTAKTKRTNQCIWIAYGHTTLNTPVLVRSLKLSNVGLG